MNTTQKEDIKETKKEYKDKNPHFTLYGKGDSAFSASYLKHERDGEFKGHKINLTGTPDTFKTKYSLYIEGQELLNFLLVLTGKLENFSAKRSKAISGSNKSVSISNVYGDILITIDDEKLVNSKLSFKMKGLEKIVMYNLLVTTLIKEYREVYSVSLTEEKLIKNIDSLITDKSSDNKNNTSNEKKEFTKKGLEGGNILTYVNEYKGKKYTNEFQVKTEVYSYIKDHIEKIKEMDNKDKEVLVKKIKNNITSEGNIFLNSENINTIQVK